MKLRIELAKPVAGTKLFIEEKEITHAVRTFSLDYKPGLKYPFVNLDLFFTEVEIVQIEENGRIKGERI